MLAQVQVQSPVTEETDSRGHSVEDLAFSHLVAISPRPKTKCSGGPGPPSSPGPALRHQLHFPKSSRKTLRGQASRGGGPHFGNLRTNSSFGTPFEFPRRSSIYPPPPPPNNRSKTLGQLTEKVNRTEAEE